MLNLIGNNKVYTVPEINKLLYHAESFVILKNPDKKDPQLVLEENFPNMVGARDNVIYYVVADAVDEYSYHVLKPFVLGVDSQGSKCWYSTIDTIRGQDGQNLRNYPLLENLPTINGRKVLGDLNFETARQQRVEGEDARTGGYDLSLTDEEISTVFDEEWNADDIYVGQ